MRAALVTANPKLSAAAKALPAAQLEEEIAIAEIALRFLDVTWSAGDEPHAARAIVLQVNRQVADPDFGLVSREKKGDQEITYRGGENSTPVDPVAKHLAEQLLARYGAGETEQSSYRTLRSLR